MHQITRSDLRLGIIAGGQLGKMLIQEASKWDVITYILDNEEQCPARGIANYYFKGSNLDYDAVYNFGQQVDILTFEMENINIEALRKLKEEGKKIVPDPEILALIQDKGKQKEFYVQHNIPTSPYLLYTNETDILEDINNGKISFPFVQKLCQGGYDGRGVAVINTKKDLHKLLKGTTIIEEKVDIDKEIAVIAARNQQGEIRCFPVVEMEFDAQANLVDKLICPSNITEKQTQEAIAIATQLTDNLQIEGLLAVELFVDKSGNIIVNEVAPRPHNSGHHTIESVVTSQFEQHLRAIFNLPLGSTQLKLPAVMVNVLGAEGYEGNVNYVGIPECMAIEGVKLHLYGKKITKPYRKMGHITIVDSSLDNALAKAEKVKQLIKVKSWKKN